jgi:hypothetical protein
MLSATTVPAKLIGSPPVCAKSVVARNEKITLSFDKLSIAIIKILQTYRNVSVLFLGEESRNTLIFLQAMELILFSFKNFVRIKLVEAVSTPL